MTRQPQRKTRSAKATWTIAQKGGPSAEAAADLQQPLNKRRSGKSGGPDSEPSLPCNDDDSTERTSQPPPSKPTSATSSVELPAPPSRLHSALSPEQRRALRSDDASRVRHETLTELSGLLGRLAGTLVDQLAPAELKSMCTNSRRLVRGLELLTALADYRISCLDTVTERASALGYKLVALDGYDAGRLQVMYDLQRTADDDEDAPASKSLTLAQIEEWLHERESGPPCPE